MPRELIGTRDNQSFYVGTDTPTPPSVTRYTNPTTPATSPITTPATAQNFTPTGVSNPLPGILSFDQFSTQRTGVDEAAIKEQIRRDTQAQVDATNSYYDQLVRQTNQFGDEQRAKVQAVNVNAGLSGSNFATSADLTQQTKNTSAVKAVESERLRALAEINGKIDTMARDEIKARKEEALGNAEAYATYVDKTRTGARADLQSLASRNTDLSTLDPQKRDYLFQAAGLDPTLGLLYYDSLKPKGEWVTKVENGYVISSRTNPQTGKPEIQTTKIPGDVNVSGKLQFAPDGTAFVVPDKFDPTQSFESQIKQLGGQGQFGKPDQNSILDPKEKFSLQLQLKNSYDKVTKDAKNAGIYYNEINAAYQQAQNDLKQGKSLNASSQALIVAFNKLIDPTSVVREAEYARTPEGQSLLNRIEGKVTQLKQGGAGLTPDDLRGMVETAQQLIQGFTNYENEQAQIIQNYVDTYGLDEKLILPSSIIQRNQPTQTQLTPLNFAGPVSNPILQKYPYKEVQDYLQANPNATEQDIQQGLQELGFNQAGKPEASTKMKTGMRTDRHNNPTAFTTDIAKLAGLKVGVDYTVGDPFSGGKFHTANLLGDPISQTIKVIDRIGFYTGSGKPRWTYVPQLKGIENWKSLSYAEKKNIIAQMYKHEGGSQLTQYFA